MRRPLILALLLTALPLVAAAQELRLPNKPGSVKFAVIGDTGEPGAGQIAIARQMVAWRARFPFPFALMMGDNLYGSESARDYQKKFADPYKALLDGGVRFYAALGNHDDAAQTQYKAFNMSGQKYYTFKPQNGVRFFALDSNYVDQKQLAWLDKELAASGSDWKIAYLPPPALFVGRHARVGRPAAQPHRTGVPEIRCQRRLHRTRALLRAHQAAEGRRLLHHRIVVEDPARRSGEVESDRVW